MSIPDGVNSLEVDSASNRNMYQKYLLGGGGGGLRWPVRRAEKNTTVCAGCHEIWEPRPPGTVRTCPGLYRDGLYFLMLRYMECPTVV